MNLGEMFDVALVLNELGLSGEDHGPCANGDHSYEEFVEKWRGSTPPPSLEAMQAAWPAVLVKYPSLAK